MIHQWTKEEDYKLMRNRHLGYQSVADILGLSEDQVRRRYNNLTRSAISSIYKEDQELKLTEFVNKIKPVKSFPKTPDTSKQTYLIEICAADLHLGKLAYGKETGLGDYDIKIASSLFQEKILEILSNVSSFKPNRFLFVVGNDFFHTESTGLTTKGTPQHTDSRWQKVFEIGMSLITQMTDLMLTIAPVDIVCVPGNHDNASNFYLGCALSAFYRNCKNVKVDNTPTQRKYVRFGTNLLGFTHGDKEKHDSLPMIMATERSKDWAETTCREFHIGHWHQRGAIKYSQYETTDGVVVRKLPSLSEIDAWHSSMGYCMSDRALECYIYELTTGYCGHISANFAKKNNA